MIICPNCLHQNQDEAKQCQLCAAPLPAASHCPTCGASVQTDASFCGQCGTKLTWNRFADHLEPESDLAANLPSASGSPSVAPEPASAYLSVDDNKLPEEAAEKLANKAPEKESITPRRIPLPPLPRSFKERDLPEHRPPAAAGSPKTQLQKRQTCLLHVQTNVTIELPQHLTLIHIGKPNDRIPPDIDVAGFPNSEIVSRVHADMRVEADTYFIEDVGSANGTYINNLPLPPGNRHRLRPGDRIALGKGDLITFLFQIH